MTRNRKLLIIALTLFGGFAWGQSQVVAQLFRSQGSSGVGTVRGNERFLRGNRSRRDFVGSDRNEQSSFVGAQQAIATGRVRPATEGLQIETTDTRRINRPLGLQPARGMYFPRLELDLESPASVGLATRMDIEGRELVEADDPLNPYDSPTRRLESLESRLQKRIERVGGPNAQVSIDGPIATIHGNIDPGRAKLLLQLLEFEPGIDEVRTELTEAAPLPPK